MTVTACPRCGSDKVIPDLPLHDHYGDWGMSDRPIEVEVHGEPTALFMKNTATGALFVRVCGECGHAELYVRNPRELYDRFLKAKGR